LTVGRASLSTNSPGKSELLATPGFNLNQDLQSVNQSEKKRAEKSLQIKGKKVIQAKVTT
jgi:hypothetical protein